MDASPDPDYQRALQMYRDFPMPIRSPEADESGDYQRLGDDDFLIRNLLFGGRNIFSGDCRILVAGGGTGDSSLYFAKRLRDLGSPGHVVHLDQSPAANAHFRERANRAGLTNVDVQERSLFDLSEEKDGLFDYVNCNGVLHHLDDPLRGLRTLKAVTKPDGGMGIWLYAKYGRTGLYHIQNLVKQLIGDGPIDGRAVELAKTVLRDLPESSVGRSAGSPTLDSITSGTSPDVRGEQIADRFLNFKDRPFSARELFRFLDDAEMHFAAWQAYFEAPLYEPSFFIKAPEIRQALAGRSTYDRAEFAEGWHCLLNMHRLYIAPRPASPLLADDRVWKWIGTAPVNELKPGALISIPSWMETFKLRLPTLLIDFVQRLDGVSTVAEVAARLGVDADELRRLEPIFYYMVAMTYLDSVA